jgi:hypothetical protein
MNSATHHAEWAEGATSRKHALDSNLPLAGFAAKGRRVGITIPYSSRNTFCIKFNHHRMQTISCTMAAPSLLGRFDCQGKSDFRTWLIDCTVVAPPGSRSSTVTCTAAVLALRGCSSVRNPVQSGERGAGACGAEGGCACKYVLPGVVVLLCTCAGGTTRPRAALILIQVGVRAGQCGCGGATFPAAFQSPPNAPPTDGMPGADPTVPVMPSVWCTTRFMATTVSKSDA